MLEYLFFLCLGALISPVSSMYDTTFKKSALKWKNSVPEHGWKWIWSRCHVCNNCIYSKLFGDAVLFFAYIGLNRFALCSSKPCLYQMRKIFIFIIIIFKIFRCFDLYIFVSLKWKGQPSLCIVKTRKCSQS